MVAAGLHRTDAEHLKRPDFLSSTGDEPSTGDLFLNANGKRKGFGDGGLLADLGPGTGLAQADLVLG